MNSDHMSREQLLVLLDDLGGYGGSLPASDDALAALVQSRLAVVADISRIDRIMERPLPMEWRARLMSRRIELDNAARRTKSDHEAQQRAPRGPLEVVIPPNLGISHYYGIGRVCPARTTDDGRYVLDLFPGELIGLLKSQDGNEWESCNPSAIEHLGRLRSRHA